MLHCRISRRPTHVITCCCCACSVCCLFYDLSRHGCAQGLDHDRHPAKATPWTAWTRSTRAATASTSRDRSMIFASAPPRSGSRTRARAHGAAQHHRHAARRPFHHGDLQSGTQGLLPINPAVHLAVKYPFLQQPPRRVLPGVHGAPSESGTARLRPDR